MANLRKDPTQSKGPLKKVEGRKDGLSLRGHVRTQDTGEHYGRGSAKQHKKIRPMGKGV